MFDKNKIKEITPDYLLLPFDRYNRQYEFSMTKARGKGECMFLCKTNTFSIEKLLNKKNKTELASTRYYLKHKQMGLAKCRNCDYITANPVDLGTRCPCCKNKFSRFIRTKC